VSRFTLLLMIRQIFRQEGIKKRARTINNSCRTSCHQFVWHETNSLCRATFSRRSRIREITFQPTKRTRTNKIVLDNFYLFLLFFYIMDTLCACVIFKTINPRPMNWGRMVNGDNLRQVFLKIHYQRVQRELCIFPQHS